MIHNPQAAQEATVGTCEECGAIATVQANWSAMGERPVIRHCAHAHARIVPVGENPRRVINASLQKHAGW